MTFERRLTMDTLLVTGTKLGLGFYFGHDEH